MGMHPKFQDEEFFVLSDLIFESDKSELMKGLSSKGLIGADNLDRWISLLNPLQVDSPKWFKLIDQIKLKLDPCIRNGGYISEKSPLEIVANYKKFSSVFSQDSFNIDRLRGKVALDFGAGVYRPLGVAIILYANGFDRVYAFEPYSIRADFGCASLIQIVGQALVNPENFNFSGISNEELVARVKSLNLVKINQRLKEFSANEAESVKLGGVELTSDIKTIPGKFIDVHFSNAVLEHVGDLDLYANNLRGITSENSVGYHIVDFLDHRYYDDNQLSPFEKYYDGVLDEINGLTPSEIEAKFLNNGWLLRKLVSQVVPDDYFARESRRIIGKYSKFSIEELKQHVNCYELRKQSLAFLGSV